MDQSRCKRLDGGAKQGKTITVNRKARAFAVSVIDQHRYLPAAVTLLFAPGQRPDAQAIYQQTAAEGQAMPFSVSLCPDPGSPWLELLAMGLTYDLSGLAVAAPAPLPKVAHRFGLDQADFAVDLEAVRIVPGPLITSNRVMMPVIRVLAGLAAELIALPGLRAVIWDAANSAMAPEYFYTAVQGWLRGGPFPAFGLTGFTRQNDGTLQSHGFALFTGYEVAIAVLPNEDPADHARFAARIINQLIQADGDSFAELHDTAGLRITTQFDPVTKVLLARRLA